MFRYLVRVGVVSSALLLGSAGVAFADDYLGNGSGGWTDSGQVYSSGFAWAAVSDSGSSTAWSQFVSLAGYSQPSLNTAFARLNNSATSTGEPLMSICMRSRAIWWVKSGSVWIYNFTGKSYPSLNGSSFASPVTFGTAPDGGMLSGAQSWLSGKNTANLSIVCSGNFDVPPAIPWEQPSGEEWNTYEYADAIIDGDYAWNTSVYPQIVVNGIDPIGKNNLHAQGVQSKITNFGVFVDALAAGKYANSSVAEVERLANAAKAADLRESHATVTLDAANVEGMAEGGVLNVAEHTVPARVTAHSVRTTNHKKSCVTRGSLVWDKALKKYVDGPVSTECSVVDSDGGTKYLHNGSQYTLQQTGFWQMISVHCNSSGFDALVGAAGAQVVSYGDKSLAAVAYSKRYDQQPQQLDFGSQWNSNPALAASGRVGFYDKECDFTCSSSPSVPGASDANGAKSNVFSAAPSGGTVDANRYGAVSGKNNTGDLTFFRDNVPHLFRVDSWFPVSSGQVSYDGHAALTTTVSRWAGSTPGLSSGDAGNGGQFALKASDASGADKGSVFKVGGSHPLNQRNWVPSSASDSSGVFAGSSAAQLLGQVNYYTAQATFASDANAPVVLTYRFEYAPLVSSQFADRGLGFGVQGAQDLGSAGVHWAAVQGKCVARFGGSGNDRLVSLVERFTGSGTNNGIDGRLLGADSPSGNSSEMRINFVRSTTE